MSEQEYQLPESSEPVAITKCFRDSGVLYYGEVLERLSYNTEGQLEATQSAEDDN